MVRVNKKKYNRIAEPEHGDDGNTTDDYQSLDGEEATTPKKRRVANDEDEPLSSFATKKQKSLAGNAKNVKGKKATNGEKVPDEKDDVDEDVSDAESKSGGKNAKKPAKSNNKKSNKNTASSTSKAKPVDESDNEADEEEEQEEEYEVKDVVDKKIEGGKTFYLVHWKGYTKADDTWEPKDSLSCQELIDKFEKKLGDSNKNKSKKATKALGKDDKKSQEAPADTSKEWEVEKIIDYANEKEGFVYRIRWKGYGAKHDTWEPKDNLFCDELIEKFHKRMDAMKNLTFKELREEPKKTKRLVYETQLRTSYTNPISRSSKRKGSKKRIYYGDSDD